MSKNIQQLEDLIWTGEEINIELAQQLAKSLGMNQIDLLENLKLSFDVLRDRNNHLKFNTCIQNIKNQDITLLNLVLYERKQLAAVIPFLAKHIKKLRLEHWLDAVGGFPECLMQLEKLEELCINKDFFDVKFPLEHLHFPNLSRLDLGESTFNTQFDFPKLTHLSVWNIETEQVPILDQLANFPMLQKVYLNCSKGWYHDTPSGEIYYEYTHFDYKKLVAKVEQFPNIKLTIGFSRAWE